MRYNVFLVFMRPRYWRVTWLYGWGPLILSHHSAKCEVHRSYATGNNDICNISSNSNYNAEVPVLRFTNGYLKTKKWGNLKNINHHRYNLYEPQVWYKDFTNSTRAVCWFTFLDLLFKTFKRLLISNFRRYFLPHFWPQIRCWLSTIISLSSLFIDKSVYIYHDGR